MSNSRRIELIHLMQSRSRLDEAKFRRHLNDILGYQHIGWEMGPDPADETITTLSLSLRQDRALLEDISSTLGLPLRMDDWCIQTGIPPRRWEKYFEYTNRSGRNYAVEGNNWQFCMTVDPQRTTIGLMPDMPIESADRTEIAEILLAGEVGERNLLEFIDEVTVSTGFLNEPQPMRNFREEFARAFPNCYYRNLFVKH